MSITDGSLLAEADQSPAGLALQAANGAAARALEADRRWLSRHDAAEPGD